MGAATVRSWLARQLALGREIDGGEEGGSERLSPQQKRAVHRGKEIVERFGGVILADAVGLGKTRVAMEMARRLLEGERRRRRAVGPVAVVAPSRLVRTWEGAIREVGWQPGREAELITHYEMSRRLREEKPSVVIVDEAHRFRNPGARRSRHLGRLTARSSVILVTATPVCTSSADLRQLLSYFLTDDLLKGLVGMGLEAAFQAFEAREFDLAEILEEVVIRRHSADFGGGGRPAVRFEVLRYRASEEEEWLWANLERELEALSLRATGKFWPRGLMRNTLMRMWESGPEALFETLGELVHFHERWMEAARLGRRVERPRFRELFEGVDREQQVFSFLYSHAGAELGEEEVGEIRDVERDLERLRGLLQRVGSLRGGRSGMVEAILEEVVSLGEEPVLIFAAFQAAAEAIFEALQGAGVERVGLLTGGGARATGLGRIGGDEALERFEGFRGSRPELRPHERIRVLVATDCISEGVNLQGCARMILADLPYSPVRLEQRIGRVVRPGSAASMVQVYLPRPESWTDSLGMRRRLDERLNLASSLGAGHRLAEVLQGPREGGGGEGPLAALTGEERIWQGLRNESAAGPDFAVLGEFESGGEGGEFWVRLHFSGGKGRYGWLYLPGGAQRPVVRLSEQLEGLALMADDLREVEPWKPEGVRWEEALRWVRRRQNLLDAARLAPALLGEGSGPVRLWRRLREEVLAGRLRASGEEMERWRRRLLRAHPPGVEDGMEELLASGAGGAKMRRFVESLGGEDLGRVEVKIVALIGIGSVDRLRLRSA